MMRKSATDSSQRIFFFFCISVYDKSNENGQLLEFVHVNKCSQVALGRLSLTHEKTKIKITDFDE